MPVFFIVILTVFGSANFYIYKRTMQGLQTLPDKFRYIVIALFIICPLSYLLAKLLLSKTESFLYNTMLWIGSFWFAVTLYAFLICLAIDLYRLARYITAYFTSGNVLLPVISPLNTFIFAFALVAGIIIYGFVNANTVKVKSFSLDLPNSIHAGREVKVMFFSDAHFTVVNNGRIFDKIINIQKELQPDIILMGGDIVDDNSAKLYKAGFDKRLKELYAPLGKYAIVGNHEYITGRNDAVKFLSDNTVSVLIDSVVTIDNLFQIAGRDDKSNERRTDGGRKSAAEIKQLCRPDLPVILLDHQPFNLQKAADAGFALQLSGHTHHGQMFPFSYITNRVYEKSWGYLKKGSTHFYISSGVGTWGPPIKVGNDAEVIMIKLKL